jgi:hypothetical protein
MMDGEGKAWGIRQVVFHGGLHYPVRWYANHIHWPETARPGGFCPSEMTTLLESSCCCYTKFIDSSARRLDGFEGLETTKQHLGDSPSPDIPYADGASR